jgi:type I restriction enzyme S subunit
MQKLFIEGLRGEAQKETEIGAVPESWEVVKVMDTGSVVTGSTPSTSRADFYGGDYDLVSPGDLDRGKYVGAVQKKLTALGFDQCRKLPRGAVLVGCIGNIGKLGIVANDRSATNQQINAIIPNDRFNGEFLYYAIHHHRARLESMAGKVTIPLINKSNFERFQIAAPKREVQDVIASSLDAVDKKTSVAEKKRDALQDLFRTLLHELMTGKVRVGEVGNNN